MYNGNMTHYLNTMAHLPSRGSEVYTKFDAFTIKVLENAEVYVTEPLVYLRKSVV